MRFFGGGVAISLDKKYPLAEKKWSGKNGHSVRESRGISKSTLCGNHLLSRAAYQTTQLKQEL